MAIRKETKVYSEQYQNLLHCLELVGLDQADARNVCGRGIYSYNKKDSNFGSVVLDPLAAYFGFNPAYIRYGKGEPLLPNSPELVYLYMQLPDKNIFKNNADNIDKPISDSRETQTNQLLHREINFTKINELPEDVREKIMKDIFQRVL